MTSYHSTTSSPYAFAKAATMAAFDLALRSASFLDFVRDLKRQGIEFAMRGKNPTLHHGVYSFRLRTLGALPALQDAFTRWEGAAVSFQFYNLEAKAIQLRLQWLASTNYQHDLPGQLSSLMHFVYKLGENGASDAMVVAFNKQGISDQSARFLYFCGVCHHMIRDQTAFGIAGVGVLPAASTCGSAPERAGAPVNQLHVMAASNTASSTAAATVPFPALQTRRVAS